MPLRIYNTMSDEKEEEGFHVNKRQAEGPKMTEALLWEKQG